MLFDITLAVSMILYFSVYYFREPFLVIGVGMIKFIARIKGGLFTPIVAESYSTIERAIGISLCSGVGRLVSALSPFILFPIYLIDPYLPFLLFFVCTLFTFFCTLTFPRDRTGKDMEPELNSEEDQV